MSDTKLLEKVRSFGWRLSDEHCPCVYSKQTNALSFFIGGGIFIFGIFLKHGGIIFLGCLLMLFSIVCQLSYIGLEQRLARYKQQPLRVKSGTHYNLHDFVDIETQQKLKPVCIHQPRYVFKKQLSAQGGEYRSRTQSEEQTDKDCVKSEETTEGTIVRETTSTPMHDMVMDEAVQVIQIGLKDNTETDHNQVEVHCCPSEGHTTDDKEQQHEQQQQKRYDTPIPPLSQQHYSGVLPWEVNCA